MTTEIFNEWKRKKIAEREAGMALLQAERVKNDRMRLSFLTFEYLFSMLSLDFIL